jgi:hypothetical protein
MALKACAPERGDLLRNRDEMQIVLESLEEGYCHVTRKTGDLELVGMYFTCRVILFSSYDANPQVAWVR